VGLFEGRQDGCKARRSGARPTPYPLPVRTGRGTADYWFFSVWFMISRASKLMPQVGKELPTKKLSDWFE
jgi:hypothetical protein